jgi:hypothetical protein
MAGEITRIWPGGRPGPWRTFADKGTDPLSLTLAITEASDTALLMVGAAMPRDGTQITKLRPAKFGPVYTIADKAATSEFTIQASDTYTVYAQLGNTEDVTLELTDTYYPLAAFAGTVRVLITATDGYALGSTLTAAAPTSSAPALVYAADTLTPVATMATTFVGLLITGTDTYTATATHSSGTGPEKVDLKVSSDTYTPVMSWGWRRTVATTEYRSAVDEYTPILTFTSTVTAYNTDVDQITHKIRPTGLIRHKFV